MPERSSSDVAQTTQPQIVQDLKARLVHLLDAVVAQRKDVAADDYEALVARLRDVFRQRRSASVASAVRDQLAEALFPKLRDAFRELFEQTSFGDPVKAAENLLGTLVAADVCADFAAAVERVAEDNPGGGGRDAFSFAGLTDFISLEEVLQLLGAGKHTGCLFLENHTNRIEVYFNGGRIAFLNPRELLRRVFPTRDAMGCREIPERHLIAASKALEKNGTPIALTLHQNGFFRDSELREACKLLGSEVLYEFLGEPEPATFSYRRMPELPEFAVKHDLRIAITPFLLESSKRIDDMAGLRKVFPDPDQPVRMQADAFVRLGELNLNPMEIKMLAQLNEGISPRQLAARVGIPMFDAYQALVRFAREGVVLPPGGVGVLVGLAVTTEESLQSAFAALDANDDAREVTNALDKAFGVDETFKTPRRAGS
ncbi:MAG TPA: DUF4388 domain-containing protein [Planctomycetota bacterium]|nr:DUF4388 domain-containing protein [Planctomycetota bacterium]